MGYIKLPLTKNLTTCVPFTLRDEIHMHTCAVRASGSISRMSIMDNLPPLEPIKWQSREVLSRAGAKIGPLECLMPLRETRKEKQSYLSEITAIECCVGRTPIHRLQQGPCLTTTTNHRYHPPTHTRLHSSSSYSKNSLMS